MMMAAGDVAFVGCAAAAVTAGIGPTGCCYSRRLHTTTLDEKEEDDTARENGMTAL